MAKTSNKRTLHRRANEHTLIWLEANYELKEGICLPRCLLYHHYLDYMMKKCSKPIGAAAFGKLVRQKFPKITTRRLGTRGQSKYNYYGVGIKTTSIYFGDEELIQNQNKQNNRILNREKIRTKAQTKIRAPGMRSQKQSTRAMKSTVQVWPQLVGAKPQMRHFPRASDFNLPFDIEREKVSTFLLMYRNHCQRILDTMVVANSEDVRKYLSHFWTGIPQHLTQLLDNQFMANVVECADSVLYSAIEDSLTPKALIELPDNFIQELIRTVNSMPKWIEESMKESLLSYQLLNKKLEVLHQFSSVIRRHISFLHLVKSCKIVISNTENVSLMCAEIGSVDTQEIWSQIVALLSDDMLSRDIYVSFCDLSRAFGKDINFEQLTDWVNTVVDKFVVQGKCVCLTSRASQLVFALGTYLSGIIRDLTLSNAKSFGFWHILFLAIEEYTLLRVWRAIRLESQSVRRLTLMKQPLSQYNAISQSTAPDMTIQVDSHTYDDTNLLNSMSCYPWDQFSDEEHYPSGQSFNSQSFGQNFYTFGGQQYMTDQYVGTDYTIAPDGSVYACLP